MLLTADGACDAMPGIEDADLMIMNNMICHFAKGLLSDLLKHAVSTVDT